MMVLRWIMDNDKHEIVDYSREMPSLYLFRFSQDANLYNKHSMVLKFKRPHYKSLLNFKFSENTVFGGIIV